MPRGKVFMSAFHKADFFSVKHRFFTSRRFSRNPNFLATACSFLVALCEKNLASSPYPNQ
jgi:hypothetical protein